MNNKTKKEGIIFKTPIDVNVFKEDDCIIKSGIYFLKNNYNDRVYIGSAIDLLRRNIEHKKLLKAGCHPNRFLLHDCKKQNKTPENVFTFLVKELVEDRNDLLKKEQEYIDKYYDGQNKCYNLSPTAGSSIGVRWSEKSKITHSKNREGRGNPMWGRKHSLKTKILMSSRQKKKVGQFSPEGKLIKTFYSITEAADKVGLSRSMVGLCCNGDRKTGKGYVWRFING